MAEAAGYTSADVYSHVLLQAQEDNPMLLIGGYSSDCIIVGVWLALRVETDEYDGPLDEQDIRYRINDTLAVCYAGLI